MTQVQAQEAHDFIDRLVVSIMVGDHDESYGLARTFVQTLLTVVKPIAYEFFYSHTDENLPDSRIAFMASLWITEVGATAVAYHACSSAEFSGDHPLDANAGPRQRIDWAMKSAFYARTATEHLLREPGTLDAIWAALEEHASSTTSEEFERWQTIYDSSVARTTFVPNGKWGLATSTNPLLDSLL